MSSNVDLHLSALIDGELDAVEYDNIIKHLKADAALKSKWTRYHLINDAMKINLPSVVSHDLCRRVQKALETEPTLLVPASQIQSKPNQQLPAIEKQAATVVSATPFGLKGYAVAASVLVVSALGFMLMSEPNQNLLPPSAMTADVPQTLPAVTAPNAVVPVIGAETPSVATQLVSAPVNSINELKGIQPMHSDAPPRIFLNPTLARDDRWDRLDTIRVIPQLNSYSGVFSSARVVNFEDNKTE